MNAARERAGQRLAYAAVLMTCMGLFSMAWPEWLADAHAKSVGVTLHDMGEDYLRRGKEDDAIRTFERAVAIKPELFIASLRRLGDLYLARKDYARSEYYMSRVLQLKPESRLARTARVQLYTSMLQDPRYRDDPTVQEKLAKARDALNAPAAAAARPADHGTGAIGTGNRDAILARLRTEAPGSPVWLQFDDGSQSSRDLVSTLRDVFTTAGFGMGCDLVKLTAAGDKIKAEKVYSNKNLVNREGGVVLIGEHLYGHSEGKGWVCLDFKTGARLVTKPSYLARVQVVVTSSAAAAH